MKQWISLTTLAISLTYTQMNAATDSWASMPVTEKVRGEGDFLELYTRSAVLTDGDTGRILYGEGQDIIRPVASTTKTMICILALKNGRGEDTVKASSNVAFQPKVHPGVREGEEYGLEDLLYALTLESYSDVAVMIAEHIGGSVEGFAAIMNEKAVGLGCGDTYFITSNKLGGVRTDGQGRERIRSTTTSDLARIMRYYVAKFPTRDEFLKITQTQDHYFTDTAGKHSSNCYNHNVFLTMMEEALSGKTEFVGGAGYSYVGAMENQGRAYVIALLSCGWPPHKTYKRSDARKFYSYGLEHFKMEDVSREGVFARAPMTGGLCWKEGEGATDQARLFMMLKPDDMHLILLMGEGEQARVVEKAPSILMVSVREGQQVGTVDYYLGEVLVKRFLVYVMQGVEKMNLRQTTSRVLDLFLVRWRGDRGILPGHGKGILRGFGRDMPGFATLFNLFLQIFALCEVSTALVDIPTLLSL